MSSVIDFLREKFKRSLPTPTNFREQIVQPVQRYFEPTGQVRTRDIIRELPQAYSRVAGPELARNLFLRPVTRGMGSLMMNKMPELKQGFTPTTPREISLFGRETITPASKSYFAQKSNIPGIGTSATALGLALDITPFGAAKKPVQKISQKLLQGEHAARVWQELSSSQPGKRILTETGEWLSQPSSFPKWLPADLRKSPYVKTVTDAMLNGSDVPKGKAGELYQIAHNEILKRHGLPENPLISEPIISRTERGAVEQFVKNEERLRLTQQEKATAKALNLSETDALALKNKPKPIKDVLTDYELPAKRQAPVITQEQADAAVNMALNQGDNKKAFNIIFDRWTARREMAKTSGAQAVFRNRNISAQAAHDTIKALEGLAPHNEFSYQLRNEYDLIYRKAKAMGIDINYLSNYLSHIYKESPEVVEKAFRGAGRKFQFSKERLIPTYEKAREIGLTPKYSNPAQIFGHYVEKLEQTKANIDLLNDLRKQGLIVDASVGMRTPGFSPLTAPGMPKSYSSFNGEAITGDFYAPTEIAKTINRIFSPEEQSAVGKALRGGAVVSSGLQDVLLSGGLVRTPLNAFSLAQITKEVLAGRVKSPVMSVIRSLEGNTTQKFFNANVETIKKMQVRNIPFSSEYNINNIADRGVIGNLFGPGFSEIWGKTVNAPTFRRFMPMLQINLFNDIEQGALKAGKGTTEAADIAAKAVRQFYGLGSTGKAAKAPQINKDFWTTFTFAPRYRESMLNFWINNVKSLFTGSRASLMANKTNLTFIVGATATYFTMDFLNQAFNDGKHMAENPSGKTDKLLIPLDNGKVIGLPFLSSIATLPRMAANFAVDVYRGDIKQAGKELKSGLSMGIRPALDVVTNENYFGEEIYPENATLKKKALASANYLFNPATGAYTSHPYLREGIKYAQGKQSGYEALSKALELPIRFYTKKSIAGANYYEIKDKVSQGLNAEDKAVFDRWYGLTKDEDLNKGSFWEKVSKSTDLLSHPQVLKAISDIQVQTAIKNNEQVDPFYLLPPAQQQVVLTYRTFAPGAPEKSKFIEKYDWLPDFWDLQGKFYDSLPQAANKQQTDTFPISDTIQKKQDYYFSLPSGTGQRTAFINANPDLKKYWDNKADFTNKQRSELGLPPKETSGGYGGGFYGGGAKADPTRKQYYADVEILKKAENLGGWLKETQEYIGYLQDKMKSYAPGSSKYNAAANAINNLRDQMMSKVEQGGIKKHGIKKVKLKLASRKSKMKSSKLKGGKTRKISLFTKRPRVPKENAALWR